MRIVLFRHSSVGMTELSGDHSHWYAGHGEIRGVSVPQHVEVRGRRNGRSLAGLVERTLLVRRAPNFAITSQENGFAGTDVFSPSSECSFSFVRQHDVPVLAFAEPDGQRAAVITVILEFQAREFRIAASRVERGFDQLSEIRGARAY
jgi:hypothetical protein